MESAGRPPVILSVLRHILLCAAALLPHWPLRLSLVSLQDLLISLSFLRRGLLPISVHLPASAATLRFWVPASRRHSHPALLLIHGFGANSKWQWQRQIVPLSRSFDLYVPDLLYFGESRSDGRDFSVGCQSRCVAAAMRELGVSKYSVAGISYGGYVAYRMAAEADPGEVDRMVIMTSGIGASAEERIALVENDGRDVSEILLPTEPEDLMALIRRSMYRPPRWIPTFLLRDFIEVLYLGCRKERVQLLRELLHNDVGLDPLPVLDQETLIIWGERDTLFPLHLAHKLHRHLGEKSRLDIVKDAGHALHMEKSGQVNRLIECFLLEKHRKA